MSSNELSMRRETSWMKMMEVERVRATSRTVVRVAMAEEEDRSET